MSMSMSMSMSCSPSPQQHAPAPALALLDEYWFFSNTLAKANNKKPPRSPSTSTGDGRKGSGSGSSSAGAGPSRFYASVSGARKLLRTPSLPSPRRVGVAEEEEEEEEEDGASVAANNQQQLVVDQDQHQDEVDDDDLNWSSIYEGVLRTRMAEGGSRSALQRAPSMPVAPSYDDGRSHQTKSRPKLRHTYSTLERHSHTTPPPAAAKQQQHEQRISGPGLVRSNSKKSASAGVFQDKKWKSSSDLESIEVQGFRDLGFVFDKEDLRESLADVLPGLKQQQQQAQRQSPRGGVRRPYLSEAWQQRPALVRVQSSSGARSAAEMKDQLRLWAQAVACNVRQE